MWPTLLGSLELTILIQLDLELQVFLLGGFKEILKVKEAVHVDSRHEASCRASCPTAHSLSLNLGLPELLLQLLDDFLVSFVL